MRLIDFDDVLQIIKHYGDNYDIEMGMYSSLGISDFIFADVASLPVIETEPVKYGKWIDLCCAVQCSNCHEEYSDEIFLMRGNINYCPNCGARMEKKDED